MGHPTPVVAPLSPVNRDASDMRGQLRAARADVTTLLARLEGLETAVLSSPETQARVLELVDALALRARALTPDEALVIDGLVTVRGAAAFTGLGQTTIRAMLDRGEIRACRIGDRVLIPKLALVQLAARCLDTSRGGEVAR